MIDTNIFLDVLLQREPFFESSKAVLKLCEDKKVQGFLSASSATDIFDIVRKCLQSTDLAYKALGSILDIVKVLTVTNDDVLNVFMQKAIIYKLNALRRNAKRLAQVALQRVDARTAAMKIALHSA